jgi:CBS domain-containing protein
MTLVGELAAAPPFTVRQDAPVLIAAEVMRDKEVGDVMVVDGEGLLTGMLTDRDIAVRVVAARRDPELTKVDEVFTPHPVTIEALAPTEEGERLMREHLVHRLPVVDGEGRPIGLLSLEDLAASGYVDDHELRIVMKSIARAYQLRSASVP